MIKEGRKKEENEDDHARTVIDSDFSSAVVLVFSLFSLVGEVAIVVVVSLLLSVVSLFMVVAFVVVAGSLADVISSVAVVVVVPFSSAIFV